MIILGIDPSRDTGVALIRCADTSVELLDSTCIHATSYQSAVNHAAWICGVLRDRWLDRYADRIDLVAIEEPPHLKGYAHWTQHRLCGRIEQLCAERLPGLPVQLLSPMSGKRAVGANFRSRVKPVEQVEEILGIHPLADTKYAREAVADAVAIALAAHRVITDESVA